MPTVNNTESVTWATKITAAKTVILTSSKLGVYGKRKIKENLSVSVGGRQDGLPLAANPRRSANYAANAAGTGARQVVRLGFLLGMVGRDANRLVPLVGKVGHLALAIFEFLLRELLVSMRSFVALEERGQYLKVLFWSLEVLGIFYIKYFNGSMPLNGLSS